MKRKTYGMLSFDEASSSWVIDKIPPHVAMRLKQIFTKIATWQTAPFRIAATRINEADIQWFMERYPLECSTRDSRRLKAGARTFYNTQASAESILLPDWKPTERPGLLPGQSLRPYQQVAIDLAEKVRQLILLDDVGLGKTY